MRLGIIQLSDIHFRNTDVDRDADTALAKQICSAITTELIGTTHIILVVSGDIAFSGLPWRIRACRQLVHGAVHIIGRCM